MSLETDDFLEHFGIKGMKWGVTRKEGSDGNVGSNPKNKKPEKTVETRKERKVRQKADKEKFYQDKANNLLKTASEQPLSLIYLKDQSPIPTVVTGKEFMDHMTKGGLMDIKMTDVWATENDQGGYSLNDNMNKRYKKS